MIDKKEIFIDGKLMEVAPIDKYIKNPGAYLNGYVAVDAGVNYIYPVVPANSNKPGLVVRRNAPYMFAFPPKEEEQEQYDRKNMIDYTKLESYKDFINTQDMVRNLEKDILTSPDNIYSPPIDPEDTAAMTAMKQAVISKHIDIDKYEPRFGPNFNNDKRTFNKHNISLAKIIRICNALDIKASLTLEDKTVNGKEPPNPMGDSITIELTSDVGVEDTSDDE